MISIRRLEPGDAPALLEMRLRNRVVLEGWEPRREESYFTAAAQLADVRRSAALWDEDRGYHFGIWHGDRLAGRVALDEVVRGAFQSAFLGYLVSQDLNGRGVATEAGRLALGAAFGELRLHRVQAAVMPANRASLRVLEKLGFRDEGLAERYLRINGTWEDHRIFALTAEEWLQGSC
ncbi:MAG: GNAT family N-acetyltransferase [Candidatus Dormibacteraceae bacterium]